MSLTNAQQAELGQWMTYSSTYIALADSFQKADNDFSSFMKSDKKVQEFLSSWKGDSSSFVSQTIDDIEKSQLERSGSSLSSSASSSSSSQPSSSSSNQNNISSSNASSSRAGNGQTINSTSPSDSSSSPNPNNQLSLSSNSNSNSKISFQQSTQMASQNFMLQASNQNQLSLLAPEVAEYVRKIKVNKKPVLPFFGTNSAGKSTAINCLLGGEFMPRGTGAVTGRVCISSFETIEKSFIALTSIQDFVDGKEPLNKTSLAGKSVQEIKQSVASFTARPDDLKESDRETWVQQLVILKYPFEILSNGMCFADMPGTFEGDWKPVQDLIATFLQETRPEGLVFVIEEQFSTAELNAAMTLMRCVPLTDDNVFSPSIFWLSNKFDKLTLAYEFGLSEDEEATPDMVNARAQQVWEVLREAMERELSSYQIPVANSYLEDRNYGVLGSEDALRLQQQDPTLPKHPTTLFIFREFVRRFLAFISRLQRSRYQKAIQCLIAGSTQYFKVMRELSGEQRSKTQAQVKNAKEVMKTIRSKLGKKVKEHLNQLVPSLKRQFDSAEFQDAIRDALKGCDEINGKEISYDNEKDLVEKLRACIFSTLKSKLIDPVLSSMRNGITSETHSLLKEAIHHDGEKPNDVLMTAVGTVIPNVANDVSSIPLFEAFFRGLISRIFSLGWVAYLIWIVGGVFLVPLAVIYGLYRGFKALFITPMKVDDQWKENTAKQMVKEYIKSMDTKQLIKDAVEAVDDICMRIENAIDHQNVLHSAMSALLENNRSKLKIFGTAFAELECQLRWESFRLYHQMPVINLDRLEPIASGAQGDIFFGEMTDIKTQTSHKIAIKRPKMNFQDSFFHEVHFNYALSSADLGILRAITIFYTADRKSPLFGWSLVYPRCSGNLETLFRSSRDKIPPKLSIQFLLSAAKGLNHMHSVGIAHRDVKPANILWTMQTVGNGRYEYDAVLADFGTCTNNLQAITTIGTLDFRAPEISDPKRKGAPYDAFAADIFSFGQTISELLIINNDIYSSEEYNVLQKCTERDPAVRPKAQQVVDNLKKLFAKF